MLRNLLDKHSVSTTALLANFWKDKARRKENWDEICVKKGERQEDLFKDELMALFIDPAIEQEGIERLDKRMWLPLATRARFFRKTVSRHVKAGEAQQVILLGGGFDTLAMRKRKYTDESGTRFFEVDQPAVLSCKRDILDAHGVNPNAEYIPLDYAAGDLVGDLLRHNIDFRKPTLILWEGNTFYLEKQDVIKVLRQCSTLFDKLVIGFDFMHGTMNEQTTQLDTAAGGESLQATLNSFAKKKSPFKSFFNPEEMMAICREMGLACVEHKTAAELAVQYDVDRDPYYTAKPYSVATFRKG